MTERGGEGPETNDKNQKKYGVVQPYSFPTLRVGKHMMFFYNCNKGILSGSIS